MDERKKDSLKSNKQNKIFISWSGENSKEIAIKLKNILEKRIFCNGLTCFVSDLDIASGTDWWIKIKKELKACKLGILCITKENIKAPWIYYEAGAMVARDVPTIPLLVNCNVSSIEGSPLKGKQCVDFYDHLKFMRMIAQINKQMLLLPSLTDEQIDLISKESYDVLKTDLLPILKKLKNMRTINEKNIYPGNIITVKLNTVFISAPMASIDDSEYEDLRSFLIKLKDLLIQIGFMEVICPLFDKDSKIAFDGNTKAINDNFINLKQVDSMLIIYPRKLPSSILVEAGYGIALCKRLVIFYREGLPYILEDAGETIRHVKTFKFEKFSDISKKIHSNGMDIFEGEGDE